jgi:hypothetical protein
LWRFVGFCGVTQSGPGGKDFGTRRQTWVRVCSRMLAVPFAPSLNHSLEVFVLL